MAVYQTNIWICDVCNRIVTDTNEVAPYDDPVVNSPGGEWEWVGEPPNERLACPKCYIKEK